MLKQLFSSMITDRVRIAVLKALAEHKKSDLSDPLTREQIAEDVLIELGDLASKGARIGKAAIQSGNMVRKRRRGRIT